MKHTSYVLMLALVVVAGCTQSSDTTSANLNTNSPAAEVAEPIVADNTNTNADVDISDDTIDTVVEEQPTVETKKSGFTLADVAEHSSRTDCWLAIDGTVYDVTDYIGKHPGGAQILQGCGKDATTLFQTQGGEGSHSSSARSMLSNYQIGPLVE